MSRVPDDQQILLGLILGGNPPVFHGRRRQALDVVALLYYVICLGESSVHVSSLVQEMHSQVGAQVRMNRRRALLQRQEGVQHRWQRFIVHSHELSRVHRSCGILRYHHRHRLADVANPLLGQNWMLRRVERFDTLL